MAGQFMQQNLDRMLELTRKMFVGAGEGRLEGSNIR
jgi:hypothetical protein